MATKKFDIKKATEAELVKKLAEVRADFQEASFGFTPNASGKKRSLRVTVAQILTEQKARTIKAQSTN